ncbi:hypothetical protein AB0903_04890 [Streptomyces sp. NPDC048389]|uniref:hypothetical protein n=1 Tax=Streptomyces sp. NPDC048389 TaxID=3154622 RepID=UPI0034546E87
MVEQVTRTAVRLRGSAPAEAPAEAHPPLGLQGPDEKTLERRSSGPSSGELPRVAPARAAIATPDVLDCDEITTALDPAATAAVLAGLARLREEHGTALL